MDTKPTPARGKAKPKKEIMKALRERKKAHGLKPVQVWVLPEAEQAIKCIEKSSHLKAGYTT